MAIKLEMLRAFRVVAEKGALADAAATLGRTPSALSMMLSQFEAHLSGPLFEGERKNRLSKLGEAVLEEAIRVTDVYDTGLEAIRRLDSSIAGTVRVAAVPSVTTSLLPRVIAAFRKQRPEVRLEISDLDSAAVRRRVRTDEADIGILSVHGDEVEEGVTLWRDRLGIAFADQGPTDQLVRQKQKPSWLMLQAEPLIVNPLCDLVPLDAARSEMASSNLTAHNTTALLAFVREGLGVTILPERALGVSSERVQIVVPEDPFVYRTIRMIENRDRKMPPAVREFWMLVQAVAKSDVGFSC
ncbi:LysR family transcriptional regulator [Thioclava sp. FR2]|uniref:LysR family transcriptional regulator n=1 Tax=Thioclava sp. FR2 TaxID=3445780 RepID=UPI003EB83FD4